MVTIVPVDKHRLYTIGHGQQTLDDFLESLKLNGIDILVDIRAQPFSPGLPHYDGAQLRVALDKVDITYHWAGRQLGEVRTPHADSPHKALRDVRLRAYADYMAGNDFQRSAAQLMKLTRHATSVIFAADHDPGACHRSLVADYLVLRGVMVLHITDTGLIEHHLRPEARKESAELIYDHTVAPAQ